jgi:ATP adenylyltransferase
MNYILSTKDAGECIFCEKPRQDGDQFILKRGPFTFVILNLYPYTVGHLMVIPYRHLPRLQALRAEERDEMALRLRQSEKILRQVAGARWFHAGINLGRAAGAGVDGHLHVHLVPRGTPDSWSCAEDPAAGDSRGRLPEQTLGLPVSCETIYRRLLPHFEALG